MMNFKDICRKVIPYDNIKCHQKSRLHPFSRKHNFEKPIGGGGGQTNTPIHFRVNKVTRLLSRHYWNKDPT